MKRGATLFKVAPLCLNPLPGEEAYDRPDDKHQEQDFCNPRCRSTNDSKAEDCSDDCDDEKNNCVVKHLNLLFLYQCDLK